MDYLKIFLLICSLCTSIESQESKKRISLTFLSRDKAIVRYKGIYVFETLHPRKDSCWFVGTAKNHKDTLLNVPEGCEEDKEDGWLMVDGKQYNIFFPDSRRRYGFLEPFSEHIKSLEIRRKRSSSWRNSSNIEYLIPSNYVEWNGMLKHKVGNVTDYLIPSNYAEVEQTERKARLRHDYGFLNQRQKRQTSDDLFMELAVYVDQAVYDFFATRYAGGPAEIRKKVMNYVNGVIDSMQILYQLSSLSPNVYFKISKLEIWNQQPLAVPVPTNMDAAQYLKRFCDYASLESTKHDHATLLSGLNLQYAGSSDLGGLANLGTVCTNTACSLAKTINNGFNAAYLLAHEIGHGLHMVHDGDGVASTCTSTCCVMAPSPNEAVWSTCSSSQLTDKVKSMNDANTNCLANTVILDPVGAVGQTFTDEAQCNEHSGDCSRAVPGYESDCLNVYCQVGLLTETILYPKLDGTYCSLEAGDNMWCQAGQCVASSETLTPVDGGWGEWDCSSHKRCGGECSVCGFIGQYQVQAHARRCDTPYANNGGENCLGSSVRGELCTKAPCTSGDADATSFRAAICSASSSGSSPSTIPDVECLFACVNNETVESYISMPNGSPCKTENGTGICVQDICLIPQCNNTNLYVYDMADCKECAIEPTSTTSTTAPNTVQNIVNNSGPCGSGFAGTKVPMYRMYNSDPTINDHFYTIDEKNKAECQKKGYFVERVMGSVAASRSDSICNMRCIKKIYRLYNGHMRDHYYTINEEKIKKVRRYGYSFSTEDNNPMNEGYCITEEACGATLPVHQFYNRFGRDHFYTTLDSDAKTLKALSKNPFSGWNDEGILCYMFP